MGRGVPFFVRLVNVGCSIVATTNATLPQIHGHAAQSFPTKKAILQKHRGSYKKTTKLGPVFHTARSTQGMTYTCLHAPHALLVARVTLKEKKKKKGNAQKEATVYTTKAVKTGHITIVIASAILCLNYEIVAYYDSSRVSAGLLQPRHKM